MLSRAIALKEMETTDSHNQRIPFHIVFTTADRPAWAKRKRLVANLDALPEDHPDRDQLQQEIDAINLGCYPVESSSCVLSGTRGMHAKKSKEQEAEVGQMKKNPNLYENRQRNLLFTQSEQKRRFRIALFTHYNHGQVKF